jgi:outer membrane protein
MKNLFKVALVAVVLVFSGSMVKAQSKIGYVNFNAIIDVMPEKVTISKTLQDYQKQFIDVLTEMQKKFQAAAAD